MGLLLPLLGSIIAPIVFASADPTGLCPHHEHHGACGFAEAEEEHPLGQEYDTDTESLQYLFEPKDGQYKKSCEDVTGLDADGNLTSSVACSRNTMNHHLGMTVDADFRQPVNGVIGSGTNAQPMTFQFSGDDGGQMAPSVTAVLYRNGARYGTAELNAGNGWTYTWSGLDSGSVWTVGELEVPNGFTSSISRGQRAGLHHHQ